MYKVNKGFTSYSCKRLFKAILKIFLLSKNSTVIIKIQLVPTGLPVGFVFLNKGGDSNGQSVAFFLKLPESKESLKYFRTTYSTG